MKTSIYLFAALTVLCSACEQQAATQQHSLEAPKYCLNEHFKLSTSIVDIQQQPIREQLSLSGKVEYNENDLVAFKSLLEGLVVQVQFELGDYVQQGQVLAVVKSTEVQERMQQKRYHENQIHLYEKQIQTKKELLKDGLAAQPELTQAEYELQAAKIEVEKINATLKMYRAVGDGDFQILAPKNGYIVQKAISVGQSIRADMEDNLFAISNLKEIWVMVNIYASNLQHIHQGDVVKVRTVAFPDRLYTGKIDKIYHVFDAKEHVLKARVVLNNQDLNLMPGLSADIIIDKKSNLGQAFAIPNNAIVFNNNKSFVVVYKDDCSMEVRKITALGRNEEYTFVQESFAQQEKIVATNALLLYEELNK